MKGWRREGPVACGADWTRRNLVWERLRKHGVGAIQKEIQKLCDAILMRTDVLVEYEILTAQLESEKSHDTERTETVPAKKD